MLDRYGNPPKCDQGKDFGAWTNHVDYFPIWTANQQWYSEHLQCGKMLNECCIMLTRARCCVHRWPASRLWFCLTLGLRQLQGYHKIFVFSCSPSEKPRFYIQPVCSISQDRQYYSRENPLVWEVCRQRSHKLHLSL